MSSTHHFHGGKYAAIAVRHSITSEMKEKKSRSLTDFFFLKSTSKAYSHIFGKRVKIIY